ncbi:uncharacterized protein LOC129579565 [Sitodiplosis mosellana]|uniref:uncharacterized protein LOC129579565 n=1 Tax=Sitodiplosis mosellana TaxID=263140 RepID=UPI002443F3B4|nr:uncharacterized protein LOC129579565 [Sitodiplosis mosellana]
MFPDEEEEISEESRLLLPNSNRISCSSHMLEKLARIDSKKAETDDEVYGAAHKRVFDKLQQIWDLKASRLSSEIFHGITGKKLIGPHRIRWLKTFDAVKYILSIPHDRLEDACRQLNTCHLDEDDYMFLEEYVECITPVAIALKSLEGNKYTFGIYLPILVGLRTTFARLQAKNLMHCAPLVTALQTGFENRLANIMDIFDIKGKSAPLYLAMCSNPLFKLNYLGFEQRIPSHTVRKMRDLLVAAAKEIILTRNDSAADGFRAEEVAVDDTNTVTALTNVSDITGIASLDQLLVPCDVTTSINVAVQNDFALLNEIDRYLSSPTTATIENGLKLFPHVRAVYEKYNCIRSTEAICERLFSYAVHNVSAIRNDCAFHSFSVRERETDTGLVGFGLVWFGLEL